MFFFENKEINFLNDKMFKKEIKNSINPTFFYFNFLN